MIDFSFYYGSAIYRLLSKNSVKDIFFVENNCFKINNEFHIYLKHSKDRLTPWQFTFQPRQLEKIIDLKNKIQRFYIVLICNGDGICCLTFEELAQVIFIGENSLLKTVRISRTSREKYSVSGTDGKLKYKIGNSDFPKKCFSLF
jgi:hypothetical protein